MDGIARAIGLRTRNVRESQCEREVWGQGDGFREVEGGGEDDVLENAETRNARGDAGAEVCTHANL